MLSEVSVVIVQFQYAFISASVVLQGRLYFCHPLRQSPLRLSANRSSPSSGQGVLSFLRNALWTFGNDSFGNSISRPVIDGCEWVTAAYVACQSGWNQARVAVFRSFPVVGMRREQQAQQSAPLIIPPVDYAG